MVKLPDQPVILDGQGVARFAANNIVRYLVDCASVGQKADLNTISNLRYLFTHAELDQFFQLIGYSVSGYSDLSLVSDAAKDRGSEAVAALVGSD